MSSFGETPSDWLDDELRRVPLPEGMLGRLRELAALSDDKLDAVLRSVPVPAALLPQLQLVSAGEEMAGQGAVDLPASDLPAIDDATLDLALRDVTIPTGLVARLRTIAIDRAKPLEDERLRDVPLPDGFLERLTRSTMWYCLTEEMPVEEDLAPARPAAAGRWRALRPAAAAAVAALAGCFLLALALALRSSAPPPTSPMANVGDDNQPAGKNAVEVAVSPVVTPQELPKKAIPELQSPFVVHYGPVEPSPEEMNWPEEPELAVTETLIYGAGDGPAPQPRRVFAAQSKGLAPAWKDADLLLFLLANKANPFVPLAPTMQVSQDAPLLTCRVPTVTNTDSYEMARSLLGRKGLSGAQRAAALRRLQAEVRPEEFLAALDYQFSPAKPGTLEVRTAGGVSPFGQPQHRLLQVAVVAGESAAATRQPTHMTLFVDASVGMAERGMLDRTRRALVGMCQRLGKDDRLSLVTIHNDPVELTLDGAGTDRLAQIKQAIEAIAPGRETNLLEGLRAASSAARRPGPAGMQRRIVIVSDAEAELSAAARKQVAAAIEKCAASGVSVWVADVSPAQSDETWLARAVSAGKGRLDRLSSSPQIGRFLSEALTGRSPNVAEDVRLTVTFNPRTVASYRFIGHETTSVLGVTPVTIDATLAAGEVCTGLFEVELRSGGDDLAATVDMTWRGSGQSATQRQTRRISRWQMADSLLETPASVQAAAVAAETAELLRHSHFAAGRDHSWARVRQVAVDSHSALASEPSFRRLMELVDRAERWGAR